MIKWFIVLLFLFCFSFGVFILFIRSFIRSELRRQHDFRVALIDILRTLNVSVSNICGYLFSLQKALVSDSELVSISIPELRLYFDSEESCLEIGSQLRSSGWSCTVDFIDDSFLWLLCASPSCSYPCSSVQEVSHE